MMDGHILSPLPQTLKNHISGGIMVRSISVMGIQYLKHSLESDQEGQFRSSRAFLPDGMDPLTHILFFTPLKDKIFHFVQFIVLPSFETTRVMEDKSRVATKYEPILDVMFTSLTRRLREHWDWSIWNLLLLFPRLQSYSRSAQISVPLIWVKTRSYLVAFPIEDFWGLRSLAHTFENRRFPCICPSHDKDPEAGDFLAKASRPSRVCHLTVW